MTYVVVALRPGQWLKNLIVFAALVFGQRFAELRSLGRALLAFILFCAFSSAVYLVNDIVDLEADRKHPTKSLRPIATGQVSVKTALTLALLLLAGGLGCALFLGLPFSACLIAYFALNLLYSFILKRIVILDVMLIAIGFVLRAIGGGLAIKVEISSWLIVCTILLALFLGFSKRRYESVLLENEAEHHRRSLREYSPQFLDQMISVVTASTVVAYAFYTLSPETQQKFHTRSLELTIPFVLYGIFRYLYLVHQKTQGGDPARTLLTDKPLLINIMLWFAAVILIIYW